jgi:hypothetical protein
VNGHGSTPIKVDKGGKRGSTDFRKGSRMFGISALKEGLLAAAILAMTERTRGQVIRKELSTAILNSTGMSAQA